VKRPSAIGSLLNGLSLLIDFGNEVMKLVYFENWLLENNNDNLISGLLFKERLRLFY